MHTVYVYMYQNLMNCPYTVNPEIFARISFARYALKDIFATRKKRDWGMIYLYQ